MLLQQEAAAVQPQSVPLMIITLVMVVELLETTDRAQTTLEVLLVQQEEAAEHKLL